MWRSRKPQVSKELDPKEISALITASQISEEEIRKWHADFLKKYPSGVIDSNTFIEYCQILHPDAEIQNSLVKNFDMIDANKDGLIDFNEMLIAIVLANRLQDVEARLAVVFDTWDLSGNGKINQEELTHVITAIYDCSGVTDRKGGRDPKRRAKEIIEKIDSSDDGQINKQEFIVGCKNDSIIRDLLARNI